MGGICIIQMSGSARSSLRIVNALRDVHGCGEVPFGELPELVLYDRQIAAVVDNACLCFNLHSLSLTTEASLRVIWASASLGNTVLRAIVLACAETAGSVREGR